MGETEGARQGLSEKRRGGRALAGPGWADRGSERMGLTHSPPVSRAEPGILAPGPWHSGDQVWLEGAVQPLS